MNELLQQFSEQQVAGFMLVLARIAPLFLVAPMFSLEDDPRAREGHRGRRRWRSGSRRWRRPADRVPLDVMSLAGLDAKEILVGLAFAFAIAVLFAAVNAAGALLDTLIGFSFGALVDPVTGNQLARSWASSTRSSAWRSSSRSTATTG